MQSNPQSMREAVSALMLLTCSNIEQIDKAIRITIDRHAREELEDKRWIYRRFSEQLAHILDGGQLSLEEYMEQRKELK